MEQRGERRAKRNRIIPLWSESSSEPVLQTNGREAMNVWTSFGRRQIDVPNCVCDQFNEQWSHLLLHIFFKPSGNLGFPTRWQSRRKIIGRYTHIHTHFLRRSNSRESSAFHILTRKPRWVTRLANVCSFSRTYSRCRNNCCGASTCGSMQNARKHACVLTTCVIIVQ